MLTQQTSTSTEWARVHALTQVLEAYPIVVDFKMYSTNPISKYHSNYCSMQVSEECPRGIRSDYIIPACNVVLLYPGGKL